MIQKWGHLCRKVMGTDLILLLSFHLLTIGREYNAALGYTGKQVKRSRT